MRRCVFGRTSPTNGLQVAGWLADQDLLRFSVSSRTARQLEVKIFPNSVGLPQLRVRYCGSGLTGERLTGASRLGWSIRRARVELLTAAGNRGVYD